MHFLEYGNYYLFGLVVLFLIVGTIVSDRKFNKWKKNLYAGKAKRNGPAKDKVSAGGTWYEVTLPTEKYVLAHAQIDGETHVAMLNQGMVGYEPKAAFPWFLSLIIEYDIPTDTPLPADPVPMMQDFVERIDDAIKFHGDAPNALFVGRVTGGGITQAMWCVRDPEPVHQYLKDIIISEDFPIHFQYQMALDSGWTQANYWLEPLTRQQQV